MKKVKFFISFLRERDWLEEMATQGPRLIFLTAPLAFLLLHAYIIYAPALMIALFVLPHMIHCNSAGLYRHR